MEAKFRLGEILINGASTPPDPDQRVAPKPTEGVRWTYEAATNFHSGACRNMSYVLENGLGVGTNIVESYAWLEVFARSNSASAHGDMDRLALRMSLQEIRESHAMADTIPEPPVAAPRHPEILGSGFGPQTQWHHRRTSFARDNQWPDTGGRRLGRAARKGWDARTSTASRSPGTPF